MILCEMLDLCRLGADLFFVSILAIVPINGVTGHWARATRSWNFLGIPLSPWLIVFWLYALEIEVFYWIAEKFMLVGA